VNDERIAHLEALLARIRSRKRPPRANPYLPDPRPRRTSPLEIPTPLAAFRPSPLPNAQPVAPTAVPAPPPSRPKHASRPEVPVPGLYAKGSLESPYAQPEGELSWPPPPVEPARVASESVSPSWDVLSETRESREAHESRPEPAPPRTDSVPPMAVVELEVDPDPSSPPPPLASAPPVSAASRIAADDASVEGSAPASRRTVEEPLESRSRLVSAPPVAALDSADGVDSGDTIEPLDALDPLDTLEPLEPIEPLDVMEPLDLGTDPRPPAASDPTIEVAAAEVSRAELDALAEDEEPPSSSRRPITIEEKMSELDDDVAPLHTPPPESGRLPAALPTFELAFEPQVNALRLEELPTASELTTVRADAPEAAKAAKARDAREHGDVTVVRAEPPEETEVAVFVTGRGAAGAKTFGEILDDALSL
jgi:hypothetical protein